MQLFEVCNATTEELQFPQALIGPVSAHVNTPACA
jgi:hypothetical protein